ncbi:conserved Plasmodium protein, unknown function [Plasmodium vinckei lentum]|uniref:Uncharacterized protein n=1 Tax=Plasmodium vinckei lentum TaxID=138297 RepID=A0A6V7RXJ2_PLAVN|nr:conserved Plasmodium protein, unknown function [Plasmodium vinckei lentum]
MEVPMKGNIQTRMQTKTLKKLYIKNDVTNKKNTSLRNKNSNRKIESKDRRVSKRTVKTYLKSCDRKRGKTKLYVKKIDNSKKKKNKSSFSSNVNIIKEEKSKKKNNNIVNSKNCNDFNNITNTCIYFHNNYNDDKREKNEKKKKNNDDTKKDKNYIYNYLQDNGIEIKNDKYIFKYKNTLNKIQTFIFPIYKYGDNLIARNKAIFLKIHMHTCLYCQNGILCNFVENYMI